ncbi:uncharacterized protein [Amphiura filiformis]|uniref:uncharacterized protein isoform X1 n=1 Tax=Amphiura filiformis TaxID=82378 RepID=UPI003B20D8EB
MVSINDSASIPMDTLPPQEPFAPQASQPASHPSHSPAPVAKHGNASSGDDDATSVGIDFDDGTGATNVKKLKLRVNGFIDLSGIISNVAVLVLLLGQQTHNKFFIPLVVFIVLAISLQIILAFILIIRNSFIQASHDEYPETPEEMEKLKNKSRDLLTTSTILLMVISVFNVFIVAFAGVAHDSGTALTSSTTSAT